MASILIFISYRRDPHAPWAGWLQDRLETHFGTGTVFRDVDMEPGMDFVEVIQERVSRCDVLIALIGKDWRPERLARPEDWVRLEIETALNRRIRVIPILVDGVRMPAAEELPESLRPLVRRQALDVAHGSFRRDTEVLIRTIQGLRVGVADSREPFVHSADGLRYVWIPPGRFRMGASPGDGGAYDDEKPAHEVEITRGFWLSEAPVTQVAWRRVMGSSPSYFTGDDLPVESVTWEEAAEFCRKVGGRLPTEAEWEYAARAGTTGARYGDLDEVAWHYGNSGGTTHPVRGKKPNGLGLYDMLGNVFEWAADWDGLYSADAVRDPPGPSSGKRKISRGGSWCVDPRNVRASYRFRGGVSVRDYGIGFRCAGEFR